jgi:hypothetical protein
MMMLLLLLLLLPMTMRLLQLISIGTFGEGCQGSLVPRHLLARYALLAREIVRDTVLQKDPHGLHVPVLTTPTRPLHPQEPSNTEIRIHG